MKDLYYTAPPQEAFDELKRKAIEIWRIYDNTYGYVDEKVNRIKDMQNISDNFMVMVAMFDTINQSKLAFSLTEKTRKEVDERLKASGQPDEYNFFK